MKYFYYRLTSLHAKSKSASVASCACAECENIVRQPVESDSLASVGYNPETQTLEVEFKHGGVYRYYNVPAHEYSELKNAESPGTHFIENIKAGAYSYIRVN